MENALSLPVNIPLGLALTEIIAETALPTIGHHHDFTWERKRFSITAAGDYLRTAFPPNLPSVRHVVINSFAARQLALRTGASAILIPNVMDFDSPPPDLATAPANSCGPPWRSPTTGWCCSNRRGSSRASGLSWPWNSPADWACRAPWSSPTPPATRATPTWTTCAASQI